MSRQKVFVKFNDLMPGERYVLSLMAGAPLFVKTNESSAFLVNESLVIDLANNTEMAVIALDRDVIVHGQVEPPKIDLGLYRHYERGICNALGTATDHATDRTVVIFLVAQSGRLWTRSLDEFTEQVMVNGTPVPRFEKIEVDYAQA